MRAYRNFVKSEAGANIIGDFVYIFCKLSQELDYIKINECQHNYKTISLRMALDDCK